MPFRNSLDGLLCLLDEFHVKERFRMITSSSVLMSSFLSLLLSRWNCNFRPGTAVVALVVAWTVLTLLGDLFSDSSVAMRKIHWISKENLKMVSNKNLHLNAKLKLRIQPFALKVDEIFIRLWYIYFHYIILCFILSNRDRDVKKGHKRNVYCIYFGQCIQGQKLLEFTIFIKDFINEGEGGLPIDDLT